MKLVLNFLVQMTPVGVSILTNGSRRKDLERCISSFLANCYYRPLVIGIVDNGSTDDTWEWLDTLSEVYGVEWRYRRYTPDQGCARGTNLSIELVKDCELQIHLESDFEHLTPEESGIDRMWLHRAVRMMNSGMCDYLYLRRMRNPGEAAMHWWDQWMPRVVAIQDEFLKCPDFWWSNNPTLFRYSELKKAGVLPLKEDIDGPKGTRAWSQPELKAGIPPNSWIHRWGMFVHERMPEESYEEVGCGIYGPFGKSGCKYGFWMKSGNPWCKVCDHSKDLKDMMRHRSRV